ncbi:MAG TPA: HU family DNA-binding protein [Planctomycetota bacterium]|nr:HU family DNA-binding protein [Planctomycetota bacterium]
MNKAELTEAVAKELRCSKAGAERGINAVLGAIARGLKRDREVLLVNFGTFRVKRRKGHRGTHPRNGNPIRVRSSKHVSFRAGKDLKRSV